MKRVSLFLVGFLFAMKLGAAPEPPFAFMPPWDDASPGVTNMSALLEKPAGNHGFVVAKEGHLYVGDDRIRFFGVNTAFGANFPTHDDAKKVAARMAKFGINCVRFHHMDVFTAPGGIWSEDKVTMDAGQLDKMDFFIAQLKENGIYTNLNLHVSRTYPGMPEWKAAPTYFKGLDLFYPAMVEMQRDYARQLLKHVNPYTKKSYADEPAVALVEINNENGLISEWNKKALDEMPDPYRAELASQWNRWLKAKYPADAAMQKAWNAANEPLGKEMLREGNFANGLGTAWFFEHHGESVAQAAPISTGSGSGVGINVKQPSSEGWHVQLSQDKLAFVQDKAYTLNFRARANTKNKLTRIRVAASQAHAPWELLWSVELPVTQEWKDYSFTFQPSSSDTDARVLFGNMGTTEGDYQFSDVSLRQGGRFGLQKGEQLGTISPFKKEEIASRSVNAQCDWMRFLMDTEESYWTGMQRFLKEDLKTRSLIVGTAAGFSPTSIQAKLDVVDVHAYWKHPVFPHKDWDKNDWIVPNVSMAGAPHGGELPRMATRRVAGKPFICTEYNGAAPNTTTGETFLLINAFAALQDWDAVFAFAYSHRLNEWDYQRIPGFFDIDQHPTKMATLPAAVAMFVRGDVAKATTTTTVHASPEQVLDATRRYGSWWNAEAFVTGKLPCFESVIQMDLSPSAAKQEAAKPAQSTPPQMAWNSANASVTVNAPRSKAFIGKGTGNAVALGDVTITPSQDWSAIALTAMDGNDFHSPGRILITAVGTVENTAMGWKSSAKNSVGKNWGTAPVQAEGIAARIALTVPAAKLKAWTLDERGQRKQQIKVQPEASGAVLELGAAHQTLWYEVDVLP